MIERIEELGRHPTRNPARPITTRTTTLRAESPRARPTTTAEREIGSDCSSSECEGNGLDEDPRHQELDIIDTRKTCRDGATEDIAEEEDEHHRLDGGEDQYLWDAHQLKELALHDDQ
jgi:hypothetical protein